MREQDGKIIFFGGYKENGDCSSDLFEYDIEKFTWKKLKTAGTIPAPRCYQTFTWYKKDFIIWGGWKKDTLFSDIFTLSIGAQAANNDDNVNGTMAVENKPKLRSTRKNFVLKNLFLDTIFSDVIFQVEGQQFPGHRNILISTCTYFEIMFKG